MLVAIGLLASACAGSDGSSEEGSGSPVSAAEGGEQGSSGSSDGGDRAERDATTGADTETDADPAPDDSTPDPDGVAPTPGPCTVDELATSTFYAVSGIPDDDPDGGLNVRDTYDDGEKLATLPEGTVVVAQDCFVRGDGGVWWAVEGELDGAPVGGWVNSAWLRSLTADEAAPGGPETARRLEALLDALAAGDWASAAVALHEGSPPYASAQLDGTGDLAAQLERYCRAVVCDAPFEVVDVRGTYLIGRVAPEVDVRFRYAGGAAIETFAGRFEDGDVVSLDAVPGRTILARRDPGPPTAELVEDGPPELTTSGLYEAAEEIRQALLTGDPALPERVVPVEGVTVSSDAYVDPDATQRVQLTADDLADGSQRRVWGLTDGVGSPIIDTVDGWLARYQRELALIAPDVVGVDRRVGLGNTIDNLAASFPEAHVVEYHRRGRGELADFNWSSVRLALEQRNGEWVLVAITSDTWTI